jgi:hypothetical protein
LRIIARLAALVAAAAMVLGAPVLGAPVLGAAAFAAPAFAAPAPAAAPAQTLAGSCSFTGPITPNPPITVIPKPGAHFSYAGTGTCDGTFDGAAVSAAPITVTFTNVATAFDTCELGPDFNLPGTLGVTVGSTSARFPITINLARLALFGPFTLTTPGGGRAAGTAQFEPANALQAVIQCGASGIATATLAGRFTTSAALVGALVPAHPAGPVHLPHPAHPAHPARHRTRGHRHRRREPAHR